MGYVYLLQKQGLICKHGNPIIKVGRTNNLNKRKYSYPKNSRYVNTKEVMDEVHTERRILSAFKEKFDRQIFYGHEYFSGDIYEMEYLFITCCREHDTSLSKYQHTHWKKDILNKWRDEYDEQEIIREIELRKQDEDNVQLTLLANTIKNNVIWTNSMTDHITLKELKMFMDKNLSVWIKRDGTLKHKFENILNTRCIEQKKQMGKKYKNVFLGFKWKEDE